MMTLEEKKEYFKKRYLAKRKEILEKKKEYYLLNRDKILEKKKIYTANNSDKKKQYYEKNKKKINEWKKIFDRNKYHADVSFKLKVLLRTRIRKAVMKNNKSKKTMKLLGCTMEEFKKYLESKFTKGMTWDKIHIDHIKPCILFDLTNPEEQAKCFHYTNLQPLWAIDNLKKGAKYEKYKII